MSDKKQVIVMRRDFINPESGKKIKMRRGKEIAQGAHASLAFLGTKFRKSQVTITPEGKKVYQIELSPQEEEWLVSHVFKKIVLYVHTEEELLEVYEKAREAGLVVELITDSGKTEFLEPTRTCLAIGPDDPEKIDQVTGDLPMY